MSSTVEGTARSLYGPERPPTHCVPPDDVIVQELQALARSEARRSVGASGRTLDPDELVSEAWLSVPSIVANYDPTAGPFLNYFRRSAALAIKDASIASTFGPVSVSARTAWRHRAGELPPDDAERLTGFRYRLGIAPGVLHPESGRERGIVYEGETPSASGESVEDEAIRRLLDGYARHVVGILAERYPRSASILTRSYGLDGRVPMTDAEIAQEDGTTAASIRALRNQAMKYLRRIVEEVEREHSVSERRSGRCVVTSGPGERRRRTPSARRWVPCPDATAPGTARRRRCPGPERGCRRGQLPSSAPATRPAAASWCCRRRGRRRPYPDAVRAASDTRSRPRAAVRTMLALVVAAMVAAGCAVGDGAEAGTSATSPERPATTSPASADPDSSSAAAPGPEVRGRIPEDWRPAPLDWQPCGLPRGGQCADLAVPLDWDDPGGPTIDLALGRLPATGDRIGSLVTNPGGPGGSGLEYLGYDPLSAEASERFDVVSWDPRGVAESAGLRCGDDALALMTADPDPDDAVELAELEDAARSISEECAALDAAALPHVSTDDVARDLEAIRRALGDEQLNYLGFSYGTAIGQRYAAAYPDRIRSMVLDGVVDPAMGFEEFLLQQAGAFDAALSRADERCAAAGTEVCGVADLLGAYDRVAATVEESPLGGAQVPVGPGVLTTAAISTTYAPDGWRDLGAALGAALAGDGAPLWGLAQQYLDFGSYGSYAAVVCTDSPPPDGPAAHREFAQRARAASPRLGGAVANEMLPCATWPVDAVGAAEAITAPGTPPILVVGTTGDAATPYENSVTVADRLSSGVLVSVDGEGHTAYGADPCATAVVDAYLVDLVVPAEDPAC